MHNWYKGRQKKETDAHYASLYMRPQINIHRLVVASEKCYQQIKMLTALSQCVSGLAQESVRLLVSPSSFYPHLCRRSSHRHRYEVICIVIINSACDAI